LGAEPVGARQVRQIIVDSGGSGYTVVPGVNITGGGGTGAMATATLASSVYKVSSIIITGCPAACTGQGYGYTADPAVHITGGEGSGATATSTIGRGANYGKIYLVTALGRTSSGARSMMQMEATTALSGFHSAAALTIDGPDPHMQHLPHSHNLY